MAQKKQTDLEKMIIKLLKEARSEPKILDDVFQLNRQFKEEGGQTVDGVLVCDPYNIERAAKYNGYIRRMCAEWIKYYGVESCVDLYKRSLLFDAPSDFDCFCRYLEWNRPQKKRFYEPRRKQLKPIADAMQELADGKTELLCISMPPGTGKALANETPILTRYGWKNHGDLVIGDEVIGMDGKFKKVIAVHPKCQLDCLVEFTNGEQIVCHENHEWMVHDRARQGDKRDYIAETKKLEKRTLDYGEDGKRGHRYVLQLPHRDCVHGEERELPLDPYTLGVWLGDGANKNPRIACAQNDIAIIEKITSNGITLKNAMQHNDTGVLYFDLDIRKQLREIGMCHSRKTNPKRIPSIYMTASIEQRLELVAGLIDTDGTKNEHKYAFTTADESLRDTFIELISTFGWRACVTRYEPKISSSGIEGKKPYYVIGFTPDRYIPCAIERKRIYDFHKQRMIAIKSISRIEPKEGNCITVEGDGMYLAGKTMLPTHNTTLAIFFLIWFCGRRPDLTVLGGSHSNSFLRGVYDEILRILDKDGEYLYNDVFPDAPLVETNSKDLRIDLQKPKRFQNFQFSSIGSGNAGKVRASGLLYCDDLVDGIETAMSRDRLDKLWQQYYTDLRQRKIGGDDGSGVYKGCVELHLATRWSLYDPIGRLKNAYEDCVDAKFLAFPAMNENDESNFDYPYGLGFTTEFYRQQRDIMDDASWAALYMNEPIERQGLLFESKELRRYFDLPEREPDDVIAVCDTKDSGPDYCVMPIAYQYGNDYYIEEIICDNGKPELIEERIIDALLRHKVRSCRFESNRGAGRVAESIQQRLKERGGTTRITTKWTQTNKDARIVSESGPIKMICLFKDESVYTKEYRLAVQMLTNYTMGGKVKHDDVPDAFSMLSDFIRSRENGHAEVMRRPF